MWICWNLLGKFCEITWSDPFLEGFGHLELLCEAAAADFEGCKNEVERKLGLVLVVRIVGFYQFEGRRRRVDNLFSWLYTNIVITLYL